MNEFSNEKFGEDNIFKSVVTHMERIKRFDITEITNHDRFDKTVIDKYDEVTKEFIILLSSLIKRRDSFYSKLFGISLKVMESHSIKFLKRKFSFFPFYIIISSML